MYRFLIFAFIAICFFNFRLTAQEKRISKAFRIYSPINIDGILSESLWDSIPFVTGFIQHEPFPGKPSCQRSIIRVAYDDNAVYVGAILLDSSPDSIFCELSKRDEIGEANTDIFGVQIIPFNDGQNSYDFKVSAANVQADTRSTNQNGDDNWDAVWLSKVQITDSSWNIEIMIPFSALRFPKMQNQLWGINYWRHIRRYREWSSFSYVDKEISGFLTQAGLLTGIENIKPPLRLAVYPYISAYTEKFPDKQNLSYSFNYGADLKYGINESFTLDMTLIPDFGQVQSDDEVLNLSPFEVRYDEKRQFFTEGTELFNRGGIFYSRRIGDTPVNYYRVYDSLTQGEIILSNPLKTNLINATKISGRTKKGLGIGVFNAITSKTVASVQDSTGNTREIETQPLTNYNVLVFDRLLKNNSYISAINTSVYRDDYLADMTGGQMDLYNKANSYSIFAKAILSQKYRSLVGNEFGYMYRVEIKKTSGNFRFELNHQVKSDRYDPNDLGFLRSNNELNYGLNLQYNIYKPFWKVNYWHNKFKVNYAALFTPRSYSSLWMEFQTNTTFNNYLTSGFNIWGTPLETYDFYEPRVSGWKFTRKPKIGIAAWISSDYRKTFALNMFVNFQHSFDYNINNLNVSVAPRVRLNNRFGLQYRNSINKTYNDLGYAANYTDSNNNEIIIFGKRELFTYTQLIQASYIFSNKSSLSFRMRHYWSNAGYNNTFYRLSKDGYLNECDYSENHDINYNSFNIDMVYTWYFAPGSELSLVWKNAIYRGGSTVITNYFDNLNDTFSSNATNNLSVKILYYLDYQYFTRKTS